MITSILLPWLAIIVGIIGVLGFLFQGKWIFKHFIRKDNETRILILYISFLLTLFGTDILNEPLKEVRSEIHGLRAIYENQPGYYISSQQELVYTMSSLAQSSKQKIRTLIPLDTTVKINQIEERVTNAPVAYAESVAERLRRSRKDHRVEFFILLAFDFSTTDKEEFQKGVQARLRRYEGVKDQLHIKVLDTASFSPLELIIIDNDHVFMSYILDQKILKNGVVFRNHRRLANDLSHWYDKRFYEAIDYDIWINKP